MRKIALLLMLVFCVQGAFAESAPADGLYSIGVSSNANMFRIVDCILRVEDGCMTAVLTMSGSGYGYLYQGTSAEADSAPRETWTPYFENADGQHCFAIEIPYLDGELPMAAWSIRYEKWYDRTLQFFSGTMRPCAQIAPDGVYSGKIISDSDFNGADCILRSEAGGMTVEAEGLSIELASLDMRVPFENGWLKVESAGLKPYAVTAPDGLYAIEAQTDSALLRFVDCSLTIENGEMTALLTAKNNSFDYLYVGTAAEANAHQEDWIPATANDDGAYTYEVPVSSLDNPLQIATYSSKKKLWYDRQVTFKSQTLVGK